MSAGCIVNVSCPGGGWGGALSGFLCVLRRPPHPVEQEWQMTWGTSAALLFVLASPAAALLVNTLKIKAL